MASLSLFGRISLIEADHERQINTYLLVFDEEFFTDASLSNDITAQLEADPTASRIYVVAPRVVESEVIERIKEGCAKFRSSLHKNEEASLLRVVSLQQTSAHAPPALVEHAFTYAEDGSFQAHASPLSHSLHQAWLFDLFNKYQGMVLAPAGVHFGKTSGKHSDRFLRTANLLLSSAVCRLLAFFTLTLIPRKRFRTIQVDTAPLLSVGFALIELSKIHGLSLNASNICSFSSYTGTQGQIEFKQSDLILISASTSGGLAKLLLDRGADPSSLVTLFYLQAKGWKKTKGSILSDLTLKKDGLFGFGEIFSYEHADCPHCLSGLLLAEFEGDQFLLQRRKTRRLKIIKSTQANSARAFFEMAARNSAISVSLNASGRNRYTDVLIDAAKLLNDNSDFRSDFLFKIRKSLPTPLDFVISDDATPAQLASWTATTTGSAVDANTPLHSSLSLSTLVPIPGGGALVFFGTLASDLTPRSINRSLRTITPKGSVAYVASILLTESAENRRDLLSFLKYGERGPNTFVFEAVHEIALTPRQERLPWDLERDLLARQIDSAKDKAAITKRLAFLKSSPSAVNDIFLEGQGGPLRINSDFVYLNSSDRNELITQADIYAISANLLAACRNDNRDVLSPIPRGTDPLTLTHSVYGQVLFCPRNFKDFNDGILHASFLRAAKSSELRYDTDESLSEEILEIILSEISAWRHGAGQALGEFLLAISTRRLALKANHLEEIRRAVIDEPSIPIWTRDLLLEFPS